MRSAGVSIHSSSQGQNLPTNSGAGRPTPSASGCEVMIMVRKNSCASTVETFYLDNVGISYQSTSTQPVLVKAGYPYGFNGQEKDNEVMGEGNSYTAEFWNYDVRLGRRWNVDPVFHPFFSAYAVFDNNPILLIDPTGRDSESNDDIRFRDSDGNLIATVPTERIDIDISLPTSRIFPGEDGNRPSMPDLSVPLATLSAISYVLENMPDIDAIGINIGGNFVVGAGGSLTYSFVYFLDGENKGETAWFYTVQGRIGVEGGLGASVFVANYMGAEGDAKMRADQDFPGPVNSYNIGVGAVSGAYSWSNNTKQGLEFWPGFAEWAYGAENYEQTWGTVEIGLALPILPKVDVGASWGTGRTFKLGGN